MTWQNENVKYLLVGLVSILLIIAMGFSACAKPAPAPAPALTPTPAPTPETTTYTAEWAKNQVSAYLNSLTKGPDAIRYLAELQSQGYFESRFSQSEVDQDLGGHKYSGWQVYYRLTDRPSKEYWDNLNWTVCKDGYVAEGSNGALLVKADLMELSQSPAPAPTPAPAPAPAPTPKPEYYPFESQDAREAAMSHAYLLVVERLENLAQTPEAREYVGAFLWARSSGLNEYSVEEQAWLIVICGYLPDNWQSFKWFPSDYVDTLEGYWHGGTNGGADWVVYDNGKIVPLANGFRVEADIEQLNSTRTLE